MQRFLIDALDLGHNPKGITRVLSSLVPRLATSVDAEIILACTAEGLTLLDDVTKAHAVVVPRRLQSRWEQWDLPRLGVSLRVNAIYSHRECGPVWGPPLVLHVPEDPEIRWERDPPRSAREHARRVYSRIFLTRALRHAGVVAASTPAVARQLSNRYGIAARSVRVIPLGVDLSAFRPALEPEGDAVFHLGSSDPRDRSLLVLDAWAAARLKSSSLPGLVVGGDLGAVEATLRTRAVELGIQVQLPGRLSDNDLATRLRHAAVVVQPSSDEGFGLQPLEAMASGAPLVVTATDPVIDVVGDAAVVCEATQDDLSTGILAAIDQAIALRSAARLRAEAYSWDASVKSVLLSLADASIGHDIA